MGHGGRRRHTAWGAETRGGGWRVAGAGNGHVEGGQRFALGEEVGSGCKKEGVC